jgi:hypothetical protein
MTKSKEPAKPDNEKRLSRVVTVAVARPLSCDWPALDLVLADLWAQSTALANWALVELLKHEQPRRPGQEKLGKYPAHYLYGAFGQYEHRGYWTGAAASANCIFRAVQKRWIADRFAVLWRRCQSPPLFRYPYPYRVHNQSWSVEFQDGAPVLAVSLPGGRQQLLLRSGAEYRRQITQLRQIVEGAAKKGELMLARHRKTGQLLARIVAGFPPTPAAQATGICTLRTGADCFWVAESGGGQQTRWNGDHVRRWVLAHLEFLRRVGEDTKYEKRVPVKMRRHIDQAVDARCRKHHDRLDSWNHEVSAQAVAWAIRQHCGTLVYDDHDWDFLPQYDRSDLRTKLEYKCATAGVAFELVASTAVVNEKSDDGR